MAKLAAEERLVERLSLHGRAEAAAARDAALAALAEATRQRVDAEQKAKALSTELTLARRATDAAGSVPSSPGAAARAAPAIPGVSHLRVL